MHDVKKFFWDEPYLYRSYADGIFHRCVTEVEMLSVLEACHSSPVGGHLSELSTRFCSMGTIGKLFTKMLMSLPSHVIGGKEIEEFLRGKMLMYGALILWARL